MRSLDITGHGLRAYQIIFVIKSLHTERYSDLYSSSSSAQLTLRIPSTAPSIMCNVTIKQSHLI